MMRKRTRVRNNKEPRGTKQRAQRDSKTLLVYFLLGTPVAESGPAEMAPRGVVKGYEQSEEKYD
jgi:hypothetical protein